MAKTALIFGVTGQDGAYLSRLLLDKGYAVHGTSRDVENRSFTGLKALGAFDDVHTHSVSTSEFRGLTELLESVEPDEIYNLSGQSSVGLSFSQPQETFNSIASAQLQLMEVLRHLNAPVRCYNAASAECFGPVSAGERSTELSPFKPVSPYGVAKASSFWVTASYREAYDLYCCSGLLFNHESPLRPERFVTRKIIRAAAAIAAGTGERLTLGNLAISRDWGFAGDYVDAMWRMLQQDAPADIVVATGIAHRLQDFVDAVFTRFGLEWQDYVDIDQSLFRPSEIAYSCGDPSLALSALDWRATTSFSELIDLLVEAEHGVAQ